MSLQKDPYRKCKICDRIFCTKTGFEYHIEEAHKSEFSELKSSSQEDTERKTGLEALKSEASDSTRLSQEETKENYQCRHCLKTFSKNWILRDHISSIHEKIRHQCHLCEKSLCDKKGLKRHILQVHQKIKPLQCSICNRSFDYSFNRLKSHIKSVHEKIKPL